MSRTIYIGATRPLKRACQHVFQWNLQEDIVIVLWHTGWSENPRYWRHLESVMRCFIKNKRQARTLVAFFEPRIELYREEAGKGESRQAQLLPLVLRLLGRDPLSPSGCCRIADFKRLGESLLKFDPIGDPETALILKGNRIMGLSRTLPSQPQNP